MIDKQTKEKIKEESKSFFEGASGCHDWSHVERVAKVAFHIGKIENANLDVIEVSAYLHDIGRKAEMDQGGGFCHAEKSAELAKDILEKYNIEQCDKDNILHCIISHRFRSNHIPETVEAKIIFDSDKLDSIGAIGVARSFLFAGGAGSNNLYTGNEKKLAQEGGKDHSYSDEDSAVLEYEIKLRKIKNKVLTETGKKMAINRSNFMEKYFDQFWREVKGEL